MNYEGIPQAAQQTQSTNLPFVSPDQQDQSLYQWSQQQRIQPQHMMNLMNMNVNASAFSPYIVSQTPNTMQAMGAIHNTWNGPVSYGAGSQYTNQAMAWGTQGYHSALFEHPGGRPSETKPRFNKDEVDELEGMFRQNPKPTAETKGKVANKFNVDVTKINNWFQNRRAKAKTQKKVEMNAAAEKAEGNSQPEQESAAIKVNEYFPGSSSTGALRPSTVAFPNASSANVSSSRPGSSQGAPIKTDDVKTSEQSPSATSPQQGDALFGLHPNALVTDSTEINQTIPRNCAAVDDMSTMKTNSHSLAARRKGPLITPLRLPSTRPVNGPATTGMRKPSASDIVTPRSLSGSGNRIQKSTCKAVHRDRSPRTPIKTDMIIANGISASSPVESIPARASVSSGVSPYGTPTSMAAIPNKCGISSTMPITGLGLSFGSGVSGMELNSFASPSTGIATMTINDFTTSACGNTITTLADAGNMMTSPLDASVMMASDYFATNMSPLDMSQSGPWSSSAVMSPSQWPMTADGMSSSFSTPQQTYGSSFSTQASGYLEQPAPISGESLSMLFPTSDKKFYDSMISAQY